VKTIYNHPIPIEEEKFSLDLQDGWKFLCVAFRQDKPFMWVEVRDFTPKTQHNFQLFGTGQDIPDDARYLATYKLGPFVLHLYLL